MSGHIQLCSIVTALLLTACSSREEGKASSNMESATARDAPKSIKEANTTMAVYTAAEDLAWLKRARAGTLSAPIAATIKPRCRLLAAEINSGMHRVPDDERSPVDKFFDDYSEDAPVDFIENPQTLTDEEVADAKRQSRAVLRSLCEELGFIRRAANN